MRIATARRSMTGVALIALIGLFAGAASAEPGDPYAYNPFYPLFPSELRASEGWAHLRAKKQIKVSASPDEDKKSFALFRYKRRFQMEGRDYVFKFKAKPKRKEIIQIKIQF